MRALKALAVMAALATAPVVVGTHIAHANQITITHYGSLMYGLPIAVALEKGYFREADVAIDGILTAPGGGTAVRNVLASAIPYGEAGLAPIVAAKNQGVDLVIVNVSVRAANDAAFVVLNDSPLRTVQDLKGKTVTFTNPKSGSEADLRRVLKAAGLEGQVNLVASGGLREGLTLVENGAATAAPTVEPVTTLSGRKFRPLFKVSDVLPPYTQTVGFTTREFATKNPGTIRGIIAARARAVDFIRTNPDAAAEIAAKVYDRPKEVMAKVIKDLSEGNFWARGEIEKSGLEAYTEHLMITETITSPNVDWAALVDQSYLPDELKRPW